MNEQYEAGIAKIHFPYSYFNVVEESVLIKQSTPETLKDYPSVVIKLEAGLYGSAETCIRETDCVIMKVSERKKIET